MEPFKQAGAEPGLDELLRDPIIKALMQVDQVSDEALRPLLKHITETIENAA